MIFYVGVHMLSKLEQFERCMVSVNQLWTRRKPILPQEWMLDSGAFTEISKFGAYRHTAEQYVSKIVELAQYGRLVASVSRDYMCEPFILEKTGLTVADHQRLTIEQYDILRKLLPSRFYLLPVLQGWTPQDYADHARAYGDRLGPNMWTGVGSVCRRNTDPGAIAAVLEAVKGVRPDLRIHGFGIKLTALHHARVYDLLYSSDSMAWSFAARFKDGGRGANSPVEALKYVNRVNSQAIQEDLLRS